MNERERREKASDRGPAETKAAAADSEQNAKAMASLQRRIKLRRGGTPKGRGELDAGHPLAGGRARVGLPVDFGEVAEIPQKNEDERGGDSLSPEETATAKRVWQRIVNGQGNLKILETGAGRNPKVYTGFKNKILDALKNLLSRPAGLELVRNLVDGSQVVEIRPNEEKHGTASQAAEARAGVQSCLKADGSRGAGGPSQVRIDPELNDSTVRVKNREGEDIAEPVFIALGHELIHAVHSSAGEMDCRSFKRDTLLEQATDLARWVKHAIMGERQPTQWDHPDEVETIAGFGEQFTENTLRREHGLEGRWGHEASFDWSRKESGRGGS